MTSPVVAAAIPSVSTLQAAAKSSNAGFDHENLVFNVDLFLLAFLALFFLLSLPRAAIRFSHRSEWFSGLYLRWEEVKPWRPPTFYQLTEDVDIPTAAYVSPSKAAPWPRNQEDESEDGHHADLARNASTSSRVHLLRNNTKSSDHHARAQLVRAQSRRNRKLDLPVHMPNWTTMLPSLSWITRISLRPGLTVGGASIMVAYFITMCYAGFFESNLFSDPVRLGWVAVSQLPVVLVLATKNNLVGILIGACYTRLNYLHRFAGRLFIIAINIHTLGYLYSWGLNASGSANPLTVAQQLAKPMHLTGFVGTLAADLLFVSSLGYVRQRFHGTFKFLHVICVIVLFIAIYLHVPSTAPYLLVGLGIYLFDRLARLLKTRYTTARITALSELAMTRIEVHGINAGWRAGQHVRIRVLEPELSGKTKFGMFECHPFTICSVSQSPSGENLTLMCKKTGAWTTNLFDLARGMEYNGFSSDGARAEKGRVPRDVRVLVEGPYGGPNHTIYASFSGALVVAGGSGITYALGVLQDLLQKDRDGRSRLKCVELVWSVQDPSAILPLLHHFSYLLAQSNSKLYYTGLTISVSYTRCFANPPPHVLKVLQHLPAGLRVTPGRPKLQSTLNSVVDRACALFHRGIEDGGRRRGGADGKSTGGRPAGVFVTVCGPQGLAEDVRKAVRSVEPDRRRRCGGVELFDEVFGH